eukprot:768628-Hanusia_phi.AAC.17
MANILDDPMEKSYTPPYTSDHPHCPSPPARAAPSAPAAPAAPHPLQGCSSCTCRLLLYLHLRPHLRSHLKLHLRLHLYLSLRLRSGLEDQLRVRCFPVDIALCSLVQRGSTLFPACRFEFSGSKNLALRITFQKHLTSKHQKHNKGWDTQSRILVLI